MKKMVMGLLVAGMLGGTAFAQTAESGRKPEFSLNLGAQTNVFRESSFDNAWFTLDARAALPIGASLEISPEVMATVDDSFDFKAVWLYPGAVLNYKIGDFFIGAGAVLPIVFFEGESNTGHIAPKANIGYRIGNFVLTAYFVTWTDKGLDFLDLNFVGATIGYRF
jgi:hypothetical protein